MGVIGLGHVGLATAVCFAARRIMTVGVDVDEERVGSISRCKAPFIEDGLPRLLSQSVKSRKLEVTADPNALAKSHYLFICVPTPSAEDGSIDLSFVRTAAETVGKVLKGSAEFKVVVVKSTVTPGTATKQVLPTVESSAGKRLGKFGLASNPEFLREGRAIEDTLRPSRLVIGTEDGRSRSMMLALYTRFYGGLPDTVLTNSVNAELIKYASNAFLATKVSYVNELANLCSRLPGADVSVVARGMGLDPRIGPGSLRAGLGYGGSCLPKDVRALLKTAEAVGARLGVAEAAHNANGRQAHVAVELAEGLIGELSGKRIALLGLAFKSDSDDMREAVSLNVISELAGKGAKVVAFDPAAMENARRMLGDTIEYAGSAKRCLEEADCCILVTDWAEFAKLRAKDFETLMRTPAVVDGRRLLSSGQLAGRVKFAGVGLGLTGD